MPSCYFCCGLHQLLLCCCNCCRFWAGQQSLALFCTRLGSNLRPNHWHQPTNNFPVRQDLFIQAQPGKHGSILEHSVDANTQSGQGSMTDRPHTSQSSLSTNCSVTSPASWTECSRCRIAGLCHILRETTWKGASLLIKL